MNLIVNYPDFVFPSDYGPFAKQKVIGSDLVYPVVSYGTIESRRIVEFRYYVDLNNCNWEGDGCFRDPISGCWVMEGTMSVKTLLNSKSTRAVWFSVWPDCGFNKGQSKDDLPQIFQNGRLNCDELYAAPTVKMMEKSLKKYPCPVFSSRSPITPAKVGITARQSELLAV